jgi:hypothetical protein
MIEKNIWFHNLPLLLTGRKHVLKWNRSDLFIKVLGCNWLLEIKDDFYCIIFNVKKMWDELACSLYKTEMGEKK